MARFLLATQFVVAMSWMTTRAVIDDVAAVDSLAAAVVWEVFEATVVADWHFVPVVHVADFVALHIAYDSSADSGLVAT